MSSSAATATATATSTKPTVLLVGSIRQANEHWTSLGSKYTLLEYRDGTRADFLAQLRANPAWQSVKACYRSNHSTSVTGPFDRELVALLPSGLKHIAHLGAGYDNIDVSACSEREIAVANTAGAVDDATADTGILLMLGALRRAGPAIAAVKAGLWRGRDTGAGDGKGDGGGGHMGFSSTVVKGHDPQGKVLGILGMGGIGRAMAKRAVAFGVREVVYHNRSRLDEKLEELGSTVETTREGGAGEIDAGVRIKKHAARYVGFDELLATADILSLNLALNESTREIISAAELSRMKRGVVIVNTARGALINEADLVAALETGQVSAVGLDVFENEPEVHPGLLSNDRAFLLPHVGTMTWETELRMEMLTLRNLEAGVDKGRMLTLVGEQKGLDWAEGR